MNKKIFRSLCLVACLTLSCCFVLILGVLYRYFSGELVQELKSEAAYLAAAVEFSGEDYLSSITDTSHRITLIQADGTVLYDNVSDPAQMDNHLDREEVQEALEQGWGQCHRMSVTQTVKTVYYALRLSDGNVLRVAGEQDTALSLMLGIAQPLLLVVAIVLVLSAVLSWRVSKRVTEPLNHIDLEKPLEAVTYEELRPLLNRLAIQNRTIELQLAQARQKEEEFRVITESMSECILLLGSKGQLLTANSAAVRLLSAGENGKTCCLDESPAFQQVRNAGLSGCHAEASIPLNGRQYQLIGNPVQKEDGVSGVVLLLLDETEKAQREQLRREFTANVSHELKTPLTSISGFAELMKGGFVPQADVVDFSESIYQEAQRLIALVGDILRLSDLDEGGQLYQREEIDLNELTEDVIEGLSAQAQRLNVTVRLEGQAPPVFGSEEILYELLRNLTDNAIKYNRPGGSVTVALGEANGGALLQVRDTGIGIPPEDQSRVFERFYRVDKSRSKAIGGTGLGLSIVRHGAEYHNASLTLESQLGVGTTVSVGFPAAETPQKA